MGARELGGWWSRRRLYHPLRALIVLTLAVALLPSVVSAAPGDWQASGVFRGVPTHSRGWQTHPEGLALHEGKPRMAVTGDSHHVIGYARCDTACDQPANWTVTTAVGNTDLVNDDGAGVITLRLDAQGRPRIAFQDGALVKLATCDANCGTTVSWTVLTLEDRAPTDRNWFNGIGFALDTDGNPALAYAMKTGELIYRACTTACTNLANWSRMEHREAPFWLSEPSLEFHGREPRMSYETTPKLGARDELRWARCTATCHLDASWTHTVVPQPHVRVHLSVLELDQGRPRIVYAGSPDGSFVREVYVECIDTDCTQATSWKPALDVSAHYSGMAGLNFVLIGGKPVLVFLRGSTPPGYRTILTSYCKPTSTDCTLPGSWVTDQRLSPDDASPDGPAAIATDGTGLRLAFDREGGGYVVYATCPASNCPGTLTATAPPNLPSAPQNLTATPGNGQVALSWAEPSSASGTAVTGYRLTVSSGSSSTTTTLSASPPLSHTVTGLTNGTTYTFSLAAVNSAGEGTATSATAMPVGPPTAPRSLTATPSDGQARLDWLAPASDGGSALQGYRLTIIPDPDVSGSRTLAAAAVTETVTGLTNATSYSFTLTAYNAHGDGPSVTLTATPAEPSPSPSPSPSNTTGGGGGGGGGGGSGGGSSGGSSTTSPSPSPLPAPSPAPAPAPATASAGGDGSDAVERSSGEDRTATAAQVSKLMFDPGISTAFVATAGGPYDALSAGPVAGRLGGPVLLVGVDGVPQATRDELARLGPRRIVALGGRAAVSDAVLAELDGLATDGAARLSGGDRYATAARVATTYFAADMPIAYVGTGVGFADALAAGAGAARLGGPVLLTDPSRLPASTEHALRTLRPGRIVLLGGEAAVSETVRAQIAAATGATPERLSGPDRYATAGSVVADAFPSRARVVFVATGERFPDALAAVPAAASLGAPVLLVQTDRIPEPTAAQLRRLRPSRIVILGGPQAVTPEVERRLAAYATS